MVSLRIVAVLALAASTGCEDERRPASDGGVPDAQVDAVVLPDPLQLPAPPELEPCPAGWSPVEFSLSGGTACDPWPELTTVCPGSSERRDYPRSPALAVPDVDSVGDSVHVIEPTCTVDSVTVDVLIRHPAPGLLTVTLDGPFGRVFLPDPPDSELVRYAGGVFEEFVGAAASGDWTLEVLDGLRDGLTGTLVSWSLHLELSCAAADAARFPGNRECTRIGLACPDGRWPVDLPDDLQETALLYSSPDAPSEGSGLSPTSPIGLREALSRAGRGTTVVLSTGTFTQPIVVPAGVTVFGACVARSILAPPRSDSFEPSVTLAGDGAAVRNVHVVSERPGVLVGNSQERFEPRSASPALSPAAGTSVEDVVVDGAAGVGLGVAFAGNELTARRVAVRDVLGRGDYGAGAVAHDGGRLTIVDGSFAETGAITADGLDAAVVAENVAMHNVQFGFGATSGARLSLRRAIVTSPSLWAVGALGAGSRLDAEDVVVRDPPPNGLLSFVYDPSAIHADSGGVVSARRFLASSALFYGLSAWGDGSRVELTDAILRGTYFGCVATSAHPPPAAACVSTAGDTPVGGSAVEVLSGASVKLERTVLAAHYRYGVTAGHATTVELVDTSIRGIAHTMPLVAPLGLTEVEHAGAAFLGSSARLERVSILFYRDIGIWALGTDETTSDGMTLALDTDLMLEDVLVQGVVTTRCEGDRFGCPGEGRGLLVAGPRARVTAEQLRIESSGLCGVHLNDGASAEIVQGEVSRNTIGICLDGSGYDLDQLTRGIELRRNDTTIDSSGAVYAPDPGPLLEELSRDRPSPVP